MSFYDYTLKNAEGQDVALKDYQGKVVLVVNTATECGFTPQYKDLQAIYEKFQDKGLEIIDIPCNQFGGQAPGNNEEIKGFCEMNFGTKFPQMDKSDVNGENQLPLYGFLKEEKGFKGLGEGEMADLLDDMFKKEDPNYADSDDIKWNFTKFLIDREGNVVERFEPTADMKEVEAAIEKLL